MIMIYLPLCWQWLNLYFDRCWVEESGCHCAVGIEIPVVLQVYHQRMTANWAEPPWVRNVFINKSALLPGQCMIALISLQSGLLIRWLVMGWQQHKVLGPVNLPNLSYNYTYRLQGYQGSRDCLRALKWKDSVIWMCTLYLFNWSAKSSKVRPDGLITE